MVEQMSVKVEHALRRTLNWWAGRAGRPGVREALLALRWWAAGVLAASAGLLGWPMPLGLGLCLNLGHQRGLWAALGAGMGSRLFWGGTGGPGVWWSILGGLLTFSRPGARLRPWLAACAVSTVAVGTVLGRGQAPPPGVFLLQAALGAAAAWLPGRRDRAGRLGLLGLGGLALAGLTPGGAVAWAAAGALTVTGRGAGAVALALGAGAAKGFGFLPAVAAAAWAGSFRSQRRAVPAVAALGLMAVLSWGEPFLLPAVLGGLAGVLLPRAREEGTKTRGSGYLKVRLELTAEVMAQLRRQLLVLPQPGIDREAMLQRLRNRTCGSCALRRTCLEQQRLTVTVLEDTHGFLCRRQRVMGPELERARERLRLLRADRRRREEYRQALAGQYLFFADYLRQLSDRLPGNGHRGYRYGLKAGIRARGKSRVRGDLWAAFPGGGTSYFVLLCDGMGTGVRAREEGKRVLVMLRRLLGAEVPPEHALRSVNAMLVLEGRPAAVTVDLAELRLDTGQARLYKWGAAPSWLIRRGGAEKIGTALPPPGLGIGQRREWTARLSLKRGETLILISDGVDGEDVPRRVYMAPDAPPGELAERLLEGDPAQQEDDATAAVIRLCPGNLASS